MKKESESVGRGSEKREGKKRKEKGGGGRTLK